MCNLYNKKFTTTIPYKDDSRFVNRARFIELPLVGEQTFWDEMKLVWRIVRAVRQEDVLLLFSSRGRFNPDLLATAVIGLWPKRFHPLIVLMGEMWHPSQGKKHLIERFIVKLADRAIYRYALMSTEELEIFPQLWQIDPRKGRFCPYFFTIDKHDLVVDAPLPAQFIFAGGNSFRDYETLLQVAQRFPERQFVIATNRLEGRTDIPANVMAYSMSHREFIQSLRASAVVVIPMRQGLSRAVGQQTYLNAMWLGKPTLVNQTLGVLDHVQPGQTAVVVEGSVDSYVSALQWVFDPKNKAEVAYLSQQAHEVVDKQFAFEHHVSHLLQIVDEAISDWNKLS